MLGNEISDYKQLKAIKTKLAQDLKKKLLFKSLYFCGSKVPAIHGQAAVALVANKKTARFVGASGCKSSWGCPVCTAKQMAKYGAKIAVALDALKERSIRAAMLTFTVPHTSGMSCAQTTEILYNVWKAFTVHGNKPAGNYKNDIFANFCGSLESQHRVRVAEYTWGKKGWHPHFHCLFWFPAEKLQRIIEWEERLNERWLELCKRYTIRQLLIGYPETQRKTVRAKVEARVNIMYSKMDTAGSKGVYISKDKTGKVIVQESSNYITGWGGNLEVTSNYKNKAGAQDHYTWQQILENAIANDAARAFFASSSHAERQEIYNQENLSKYQTNDNLPNEESCKMKLNEPKPAGGSRKKEDAAGAAQAVDWWELYFEYMTATRTQRHARINFSVHSGLMKIIAEYKKTQAYKTVLKKNATDRLNAFGVWKTVCWFTKSQWSAICKNDLEVQILQLATAENAKKLIDRVLEIYEIPPSLENQAEAAKLEAILNAA